jgi:hypothetical protein
MSVLYLKNVAGASRRRDDLSRERFSRFIGDLILGLDMAGDHIQCSDLGGTNEAHEAINRVVEFLDELRGA